MLIHEGLFQQAAADFETHQTAIFEIHHIFLMQVGTRFHIFSRKTHLERPKNVPKKLGHF
ncbi:hypothetical protein KSB_60220 [Ktedonobacter robiniae]|uniref:Uncharacterized protein n=1 Tax=Ktedonobacter robiniae TaxID=2778365 RepID=A0ABQ3UY02_9CHLR|nr:hypothetical protein KSB_60220 [Ktedonobacter robiniae]